MGQHSEHMPMCAGNKMSVQNVNDEVIVASHLPRQHVCFLFKTPMIVVLSFGTSDAVNFSLGPAVIHSLTPFSFSRDSSSFKLGVTAFISLLSVFLKIIAIQLIVLYIKPKPVAQDNRDGY